MHGDFLWSTLKEDARATLQILENYRNIKALIVDHYGIYGEWDALVSQTCRIFKIDDLADRKHTCSGLVDQNFYSDAQSRYDGLTPKNCAKLLGPKYAILRPQFKDIDISVRSHRERSGKILLAFGAADPNNFCIKVAETLLRTTRSEVSVLGQMTSGSAQLWSDLSTEFHGRLRGPRFLENPCNEMMWADLYIGAGGSITWERFACGLVGIVYSIAKNQEQAAIDLEAAGIQIYAGPIQKFDPERLIALVNDELTNTDLAKKSAAMRQLVDGHGAERIVKEWQLL
jgi:UDP-2,4-diacetamido-2,4,6-trideoxy-beta-L-altropyranose hydrolase